MKPFKLAGSLSPSNGHGGSDPAYDSFRVEPPLRLVIYPDAGHGGIFQFHDQFVEKALEFLAT